MTHVRGHLLASVAGLVLVGGVSAASADQLLTGSITSASGQKLEGVLVSAKKEGSTITTSVYTDQNGEYFFPAMADGKYDVWAQTLGFKTGKGAVDLSATKHQDFQLATITDPEERGFTLGTPAIGDIGERLGCFERLRSVEPRREHGVNRLGERYGVGALLLDPVHHLIGEERVPARSLHDLLDHGAAAVLGRASGQEPGHELVDLLGLQRLEGDRRSVEATAAPSGPAVEQLVAG